MSCSSGHKVVRIPYCPRRPSQRRNFWKQILILKCYWPCVHLGFSAHHDRKAKRNFWPTKTSYGAKPIIVLYVQATWPRLKLSCECSWFSRVPSWVTSWDASCRLHTGIRVLFPLYMTWRVHFSSVPEDAAESHVTLRFLWVSIFKDTYLWSWSARTHSFLFFHLPHIHDFEGSLTSSHGAAEPGSGSHMSGSRHTEQIRCITRGGKWSWGKGCEFEIWFTALNAGALWSTKPLHVSSHWKTKHGYMLREGRGRQIPS